MSPGIRCEACRNPFQMFRPFYTIDHGLHEALQLHVSLDISMTSTVATTDFGSFTELSKLMFGGQSQDIIEKIAQTKFGQPPLFKTLSGEYATNDRTISLNFEVAGTKTLTDVRIHINGLLRLLCSSSVMGPKKPANIIFVFKNGMLKSKSKEEITMPIATLKQSVFL
jgi:hypothetical protein